MKWASNATEQASEHSLDMLGLQDRLTQTVFRKVTFVTLGQLYAKRATKISAFSFLLSRTDLEPSHTRVTS